MRYILTICIVAAIAIIGCKGEKEQATTSAPAVTTQSEISSEVSADAEGAVSEEELSIDVEGEAGTDSPAETAGIVTADSSTAETDALAADKAADKAAADKAAADKAAADKAAADKAAADKAAADKAAADKAAADKAAADKAAADKAAADKAAADKAAADKAAADKAAADKAAADKAAADKAAADKAAAASAGSATAGAGKVGKCKACHTFDSGGADKMGPNLFAIHGRSAGKAPGFKYGSDLQAATFVWDEQKLALWVCDSPSAIKSLTGNSGAKTKMSKQNKCGGDAQDIAAYLKSLK
ncbi:Cytochrome c2 [Mariprofundus ferrinatatus]|uniref:Cytochrome c2 n=1 Tax=Mariprofundus ferrinatatus TaxID=1921087 RepID=A0A2K8L9E9_9PROT|nr:c-type cytochrome [Mariprofundus ferrinatatus]ATX82511.1 Cytochrome c2 [Mariprofundus ferrinatatus]